MTRRRFLVGYNYGQGGRVCYIYADSAKAITDAYPELQILDETTFFSYQRPEAVDELRRTIETHWTHDLDDPPAGLLKAIIDGRGRTKA
jgi:hypothetical protein